MAYKQADRELLLTLLKLQEKTAPINISIGYVDEKNQVRQGLILHEAAPAILNQLIKEGYVCSLTHSGMFVCRL